jgi:hypothetical protein
MLYFIFPCLFLFFNFLNLSSPTTTTTLPPLILSNNFPLITHFLVFSSNMETVITFEPKHGWLLNEERKFRLYLSGINLHRSMNVHPLILYLRFILYHLHPLLKSMLNFKVYRNLIHQSICVYYHHRITR